jgi:hypothetical protein
MRNRPYKTELLRAVEGFLTDVAIPKLENRDQFLARVAANSIKIALREIDLEEHHLRAEVEALASLLGDATPRPASIASLTERSATLYQDLCARIRAGEFDHEPRRGELMRLMKEAALADLAINDPGLAERIRREWAGE